LSPRFDSDPSFPVGYNGNGNGNGDQMAREGRILLEDGTFETVPNTLTDLDQITWPPVLPEKSPTGTTPMIQESDWFRRHEVNPAPAPYVYLKDSTRLADVPAEIIDMMLDR
jgi:hypothetical protein